MRGNPLVLFQRGFEARLRAASRHLSRSAGDGVAAAARCSSRDFLPSSRFRSLLLPYLGRNFFPAVDAGNIRCTSAPRSAPASRRPPTSSTDVQKAIRKIIPPDQIETLVDNIGLPILRHQPHLQQHRRDRSDRRRHPDHAEGRPPAHREYVRELREQLPRRFPGMTSRSCRPTSSARSSTSARRRRSTCRCRGADQEANRSTPASC